SKCLICRDKSISPENRGELYVLLSRRKLGFESPRERQGFKHLFASSGFMSNECPYSGMDIAASIRSCGTLLFLRRRLSRKSFRRRSCSIRLLLTTISGPSPRKPVSRRLRKSDNCVNIVGDAQLRIYLLKRIFFGKC